MPYIMRSEEMDMAYKQRGPEEFIWKHTKRLSELADSQQMDGSIVGLEPGKVSYPYHFHHNSEETFVILSGRALLRTPDGFSEVKQGDVIFFEKGKTGAHQLYNHTDYVCEYLDLSITVDFNVCEYPDTGKINIYGDNFRQIHMKDNTVDYFEGEDNVLEAWSEAIKEFK